eukprot:1307311-Pleurochrysis_carterae.AAC.6
MTSSVLRAGQARQGRQFRVGVLGCGPQSYLRRCLPSLSALPNCHCTAAMARRSRSFLRCPWCCRRPSALVQMLEHMARAAVQLMLAAPAIWVEADVPRHVACPSKVDAWCGLRGQLVRLDVNFRVDATAGTRRHYSSESKPLRRLVWRATYWQYCRDVCGRLEMTPPVRDR